MTKKARGFPQVKMLTVSGIVVTAPSFGNVLKIFLKLPSSAFY
jgi:hypothetical protein